MAERCLLAKHKLSEFVEWARTQGYRSEPTRGDYEVARLRRRVEPPVLIFDRNSARVHFTVMDKDYPLVRRWLRETKAVEIEGTDHA